METARLVLDYIEALIWPVFALIILFMFRSQISNLITRLKKVDLPGGISAEAFQEKIRATETLSLEVVKEQRPKSEKKGPDIPLTEANARMINVGLAPTPTGLELSRYRILAEEDPQLALAGLRIELETMLKNVAKGFKIPVGERDSAGVITRKLHEHGAITSLQAKLINAVLDLCNAAVHGQRVTQVQVGNILDTAAILRDDYISWLSWGFPKK